MGQSTRIDWCDSTWNPVTGCLHGCEYCYARGIANRFGLPYAPKLGDPGMEGAKKYDSSEGMDTMLELAKPYERNGRKQPYPMGFLPTMHRYKLDEPQKWTRPRTIFVCSMADLFGEWVPDSWIEDVFAACENAPQHRYLFLTKNPNRYIELARKGKLPRQHWYGYSATGEDQLWRFHHADECPCINLFVSIEPMLEPMQPCFSTHTPADWVIIGAETGHRKDKVVPEKKWVDSILMECEYSGRPIFMKESLRGLMGKDFRQEFPWDNQRQAGLYADRDTAQYADQDVLMPAT